MPVALTWAVGFEPVGPDTGHLLGVPPAVLLAVTVQAKAGDPAGDPGPAPLNSTLVKVMEVAPGAGVPSKMASSVVSCTRAPSLLENAGSSLTVRL